MLARFLQSAEGLARRLDRAHGATYFRWPLVADVRLLEHLSNLLRTAAVGRDGVEVCKQAAQAVEQLAAAVKAHDAGDLAPWRSSRDTVRGILAGLRELLIEPEADADVAGGPEAVTATPPGPTPAVADVEPERKGQEGEKVSSGRPQGRPPKAEVEVEPDRGNRADGNKVDAIAEAATRNARKLLRVMLAESATAKSRSWNMAELADHAKLTDGQMRRAMEWLRRRGLYVSHTGQDGGVWLTPLGAEVAGRLK